MLGIVLINYKNSKETLDYIKNELCKIKTPYSIAVVDNSCDSNEFNALSIGVEKIDPKIKIHLIRAEENCGYAKGNNIGAKKLIQIEKVDYLLFSNSDIIIKDKKAVENLINTIRLDIKNVCVGPKLVGPSGSDQNPNKNVTFFDRYILSQLLYPLKFVRLKETRSIIRNAESGFYDWISGAFFIIDAKVFEQVGMFDEGTFLYAEEMILGERLRNNGYSPYYDSSQTILHLGSVTVSNFYSAKKRSLLILKSELYFYSKYKGLPNKLGRYLGKLSHEIYYRIYMRFILLRNRKKC